MLPKSYISPSQINTYLRCPAQYFFSYVQGIKIPPKSAMTKGKAVHSGIEYNYKQKIESREDLKVSEILEYTAAEFEKLAEETDWQGVDKGKEKDSTIDLTKLYQTEVAPETQPIAVEQKIEVAFENTDYTLLGIIDLIDEEKRIRDTKTTARTPSEDSLQNSLQLSAYSLAYRTIKGEEETGIQLDYLVATKTPKVVKLSANRTQKEIDRFLSITGTVAHNISCQNFYPNPTNMMCSPVNCGYWEKCIQTF